MQWGLIAGVPLVFFLGVALAHHRREDMLGRVKSLRADFAKSAHNQCLEAVNPTQSTSPIAAASFNGFRRNGRGRGVHQDLTDSNSKLGHSFDSAIDLQTAIRVLLSERDQRGQYAS